MHDVSVLLPQDLKKWHVARVAIWVLVTGLVVWGGYAWLTRDTSPSCSWPLRVEGQGTADEAGVVRCYLRDLAKRDTAGLSAIALDIDKNRITAADLKYSADARSGVATAYLWPSPVDDSDVAVVIIYADRVKETADLGNLDAFVDPNDSSWRMTIGSAWDS